MKCAIDAIRNAEVRDGLLVDPVDSGQVLTSERIRVVIEHTLIDCGCESCSTIVAGGKDGAEPYNTGTGFGQYYSTDPLTTLQPCSASSPTRYCRML